MTYFFRGIKRPDILIFLGACLAFSLFPGLDLAFSSLFYDSAQGGFLYKEDTLVLTIYRAVPVMTSVLVCGLLTTLFASLLSKQNAKARRAAALFLLAALVMGPGLMVNEVLKGHWHRPRPRQVEQFGGELQFTPALMPTGDGGRNSSFVSGHASVGFFVMAFGFVSRRRRVWVTTGLLMGSVIGLVRVIQGAHFLSDVVFSGLVTWGTVLLLSHIMAAGLAFQGNSLPVSPAQERPAR